MTPATQSNYQERPEWMDEMRIRRWLRVMAVVAAITPISINAIQPGWIGPGVVEIAVEVARLQLDDLDWRRGEVVIRGKGRRDERLPLPTDVGEAIVAYLRHDRPSIAERSLFINVRVPYAPMTAQAVKDAVRSAAGRAGLSG